MKIFGSNALVVYIIISVVSSILLYTGLLSEKGKELKNIPKVFQGIFVETTESTALGGLDPIRIQVSNGKVLVSDPNQDNPVVYSIIKVIEYDKYIDLYYPNTAIHNCIRIYPIKGLFYFYNANTDEEYDGRNEDEIGGGFAKSL